MTGEVVKVERGEQAATARRAVVTHRARALIEQAFDELDSRKKRGLGDFVARLADQLLEDPLTGLARITAMFPEPVVQAGNTNNISALFLQATQLANGHTPGGAMVIAGTIGVQPEPSDW